MNKYCYTLLLITMGTIANAEDKEINWHDVVLCQSDGKILSHVLNSTNYLTNDSEELGLRKVHNNSPFMTSYVLDKPFTVAGYTTDRIAFADAGVLAIVDESDSKKLAKQLSIPLSIDLPNKVMGKKVIRQTEPVTNELGSTWQEVSLNISTVDSFPKQTLLGCNYKVHFKMP